MEQGIANIRIALFITETLTAIVALSNWNKLKDSYWRYFPIYLTWISIAEWVGYASSVHKEFEFNAILYTFFVEPSEYLFFVWLTSNIVATKNYKKTIFACFSVFFLTIVFVEYRYLSSKTYFFMSLSNSVGTLFLLIMILWCLYDFVFSDKILQYRNSLEFWVLIGITLFYFLSFPFYGMWNILLSKYYNIFIRYNSFVLILSIMMYVSFSIGILWSNKQKS